MYQAFLGEKGKEGSEKGRERKEYCVLSNHCHIQILDVSHSLLTDFVSGLPFPPAPPPAPLEGLILRLPISKQLIDSNFSCLALLLACLSKIILLEQDLPEALPNGKVSFKSTVKPLLSGHLHNLPKCWLNRGCPLKRGFLTFVQCLLTMNLQRLLCTVLKFHVVKEAKEAVLYFVQDF